MISSESRLLILIHFGGLPEPPPRVANVVKTERGITANAVIRSKNDVCGTTASRSNDSKITCSKRRVRSISSPNQPNTTKLAILPSSQRTNKGASQDNLVIETRSLRVNAAIPMYFLANIGKIFMTITRQIKYSRKESSN